MKLATRISSIRRQAWKQCRSCSADSDSMWRDSLASSRLAGCTRSPRGLERRRDRVLREPVDLEVGVQPAQLAGDGDVAPGVAEADRRGQVERALAAGRGRASSVRGAAPRRGEVAQQQVDPHRVARVRAVAGALEHDELAAGHARRAAARASGRDGVIVAVDARAPDSAPAGTALPFAGVVDLPPSSVCTSVSGVVSSPQPTQSSICLVECGSEKT